MEHYRNDNENKDNNELQHTPEQTNESANGHIQVNQPKFFDFGSSGSPKAKVVRPARERSGRSGKTAFTAFMAGAVVVGSMMFAADKMNLFTGGTAQPLSSGKAVASSGGSNAAGVKTASVDLTGTNTISNITEQASPAVVKIETKVKANKTSARDSLSDDFFRQFFGGQYGGRQQQQQQGQSQDGQLQEAGIGSGFIFESSGYILTNEHVINGADEIDVYVQGYDKPFVAKLLGSSYDLDLAVLKIEDSKALPTLPIGNSDNAKVGEWVVAIGNPYDFDYTVTAGLLSAKERPISIADEQGTRNYKHLIQTDAAINPGNSGGPLLNMNGEVIGINTAVNSEAQGIGFAIPTSTISSVLQQLKDNVEIPKEASPFIGVSVQDVTSDLVSDLKLSNTDGALVADVQRKTPAFEAGIRPYDVIVAVNGKSVATADALTKQVQALKVGDKVTFTVIREGNKQDVSITIADRNAVTDTKQSGTTQK